ncbi:tetratricopeptide repeat protein [Chitinimonas arctica]|uniref:Tetratricopeptide repeat protein n=1 Tax=Chitinimonas arctica TaxID=2594795 RepID=A0A516SDQ1_9NEIS|nr:tetratricopeptide repeat protein [Chitinimonas arctica]QDQ26271.1 tetratricopeptide repeat protein [Chitinimonas arctica]
MSFTPMEINPKLLEHLRAGHQHHLAGQFDEAETQYRAAIAIDSTVVEARFLLGSLMLQTERGDEACELLTAVAESVPGHIGSRYNLGLYYFEHQDWNQARKYFQEVDSLDSTRWDVVHKLGLCAYEQNRAPEIIQYMHRCVQMNPTAPNAKVLLTSALSESGRFAASARYASEWNYAVGGSATARVQFARALARAGMSAQSDRLLAEARDPDSSSFLFVSGYALQASGRLQEACDNYRRAVELEPDFVAAHLNRGMVLLTLGQMEEGWREFDWRFRRGASQHYAVKQGWPEWDGRQLDGDDVLVHSEQGFGDVIQFMRFFHLIEERGGRVIFDSYPDVLQLLKTQKGAEVRDVPETFNLDIKWQIPLLNLGKLFAVDLDCLPTDPYVNASPALVEKWAGRFPADDSLRVGLVWSGNPAHANDHNRSMALKELAPLGGLPGLSLYALQKGVTEGQSRFAPIGMTVVDLSSEIQDFSDTAAIIEQLDLVICVDTSVAHLAGAMGKPVWLLLPAFNDWRWLEHIENSPWYPSMRVFRQQRGEGWGDVVERVTDALAEQLLARPKGLAEPFRRLMVAEQDGGELGELLEAVPDELLQAPKSLHFLVPLAIRHQLTAQLEARLPDQSFWRGWLGKSRGEAGQAIALWRDLLAQPQADELLVRRALCEALWTLGQASELPSLAQQSLQRYPDCHEFHYWLGQGLRASGAWAEAEACYRQVLAIAPRWAEARINLGLCLWRMEQRDEALAQFEYGAMCNRRHPLAWFYVGWYLYELQCFQVAEQVLDYAVTALPAQARTRFWLGCCRQRLGKLEEAFADFQQAFEADPALADIKYHLAMAAGEMGDWPRAEVLLREILSQQAGNALANIGLAVRQLRTGNWSEGWARWESRLQLQGNVDNFAERFPGNPLPRWDGSPLAGRHLLLLAEQGMGDTLQFLRFAQRIEGHVTLAVQDSLCPLLQSLGLPFEVAPLSPMVELMPAADCYVELMSLPHLLNLQGQVAPVRADYIAPPLQDHPLRDLLAEYSGLKVGLVWAGNAKFTDALRRHCPLAALADLIRQNPSVHWISLQKDAASNQAMYLPEVAEQLLNVAPEINDWLDTACIVSQLDLVLTVDTAVAHLAAAMNKPVWLLVSTLPDWRWGEEGEQCDWYPSVRIFRQSQLGDWPELANRVGAALAELCPPEAVK